MKSEEGLPSIEKVYVRLLGGLGNQLFQASAALSGNPGQVMLITGLGGVASSPDVSADIEGFRLPDYTSLIDYRSLPFLVSTRKPLNLLHRTGLRAIHSRNWLKAHRETEKALSKTFSLTSSKTIKLMGGIGVGFDSVFREPTQVTLMTGYFQSWIYAKSPGTRNFLLQLEPKFDHSWLSELAVLAEVEKPIILHVRLGDYIGNSVFGSLTQAYYSDGLSYLRMRGLNTSRIWLFSDEPSKVHQILPEVLIGLNPRVIESDGVKRHPSSVMKAMSLGRGFVLANSTFGYWAAMMSSCDEQLVVVPDPWFANQADPIQLVPQKWMKVARE